MGSYVISVSVGTGCYRHIQISDRATLCELHTAIIDAFDFYCDEYMAHAFFMDNRFWSPKDAFFSEGIDDMLRGTSKYTLKKLKVHSGDKFKYLFDFEEEHRIQCKVLRELQENTPEAKVIRSVGEDPQQHFGCDNAEADSDDSFDEYFPEEYEKEILETMYASLAVPAETVSLLREYFDCAVELYGIIPLRKLLDIYNTHNTPISENDFLRVSEVFRYECHTYAILGQEALYEDAPVSAPIDRELVAQHLYYDDLEDYQAFDGISTNVAAADKTYSMIDEIIEKFNLRYAEAEVIIKDIMTSLSDDADLHSNVRDSSPSAYEAVVDERVDSTIMDGMFNSMMAGDSERAEFFSELSENKPVKMQIRNSVIRRIKDFLLSA